MRSAAEHRIRLRDADESQRACPPHHPVRCAGKSRFGRRCHGGAAGGSGAGGGLAVASFVPRGGAAGEADLAVTVLATTTSDAPDFTPAVASFVAACCCALVASFVAGGGGAGVTSDASAKDLGGAGIDADAGGGVGGKGADSGVGIEVGVSSVARCCVSC